MPDTRGGVFYNRSQLDNPRLVAQPKQKNTADLTIYI